MFGLVIDKLGAWLSPAFLFANYFPWLIFTAINLVMVYLTFTDARPIIERYVGGEPGEKAIVSISLLGAIAVAAYTTAPMVGFMTEVLEGKYIPQWIRAYLSSRSAGRLDVLDSERRELLAERIRLHKLKAAVDRLNEAQAVGEARKDYPELYPVLNSEPDLVRISMQALAALRLSRSRNKPITAGQILPAIQSLRVALEHNCESAELLPPTADATQFAISECLANLHRQMPELVKYAFNTAAQGHRMKSLEWQKSFATDELWPTRLGNDAAALRGYCETRYAFDFDFFWPRLQVVLQKNEKISGALVSAKAQLDFCVLMLWLTTIFTITWIALLTLFGRSVVALYVVALLGPFVIRAWLGVVHASYAGFADLVRCTVDLNRFDLLTALRLRLPPSSVAEKEVWKRAAAVLTIGEHERDDTYSHPAPR